ncbi:MAG: ADOP family duplicated permease [Terriglobales bacterium]
MSRLRDTLHLRLRTLFCRQRVEAEMDAELRFHLDNLIAEKRAAGMDAREARTAALRAMSAGDWIAEECRDARGLRWLESFAQDARYALRQMRHHPGFTSTVILILALGIGANTAIFSVTDAVLLRPLPYPHPQELMQLYMTKLNSPGSHWWMDYPDFVDWQKQNQAFADMALYTGTTVNNLANHKGAISVQNYVVSAGFFQVFGIRPILGRGFTAADTRPGHTHEAVLSYAFWMQQFGGNAGIVGQTVKLNEKLYTILGVIPPGFKFPWGITQLWTPLEMTASAQGGRGDHHLFAVGRLKSGVTVAQAHADLSTIAARLANQYPKDDKGFGAVVVPLHAEITGSSRRPLLLILWAAALLWLIACVDVGSMLLARSVARQPEMAIRMALGSSRVRLAQQLLTETILLACAGGAAGLALAFGGIRWLTSLKQTGLATPNPIRLDLPVLAFAFSLAVVTGIAFGLALAWRGPGVGLGVRATVDRRRAQLNRGLVMAEIALSVMLLAAAGLLLDSQYRLVHAPIGINPNGVLTARISLPEVNRDFWYNPQDFQFAQALLHRVEALPGVQTVALSDSLPLSWNGSSYVAPRDRPWRGKQELLAEGHSVTPAYFHLFGIAIVRGRGFSTDDETRAVRLNAEYDDGHAPTAAQMSTLVLPTVINQTLARDFWPGQDPVGQEIWFGPPGPSLRVIGVVANVANQSLGAPVQPELYQPFVGDNWLAIAIRSAHPLALVPSVRKVLAAINPDLALFNVATMQQTIDQQAGGKRFLGILVALFAGLALILAFAGIYGVLSYAVAQRRQEMGIRLSLGGQPSQLVRQVLGDGMRLTGWGILAGMAGALAAGRLLASSLYKVSSYDPAILAATALVIAAAAACACYGPARRAARVDPAEVLREG